MEKTKLTAYQNAAKAALMTWPPHLSGEEADKKVCTETFEELESQCYAKASVESAALGIAKILKLNEEEAVEFGTRLLYGPADAEIFEVVRSRFTVLTYDQILEILAVIHDRWVVNNSSEKTFNKKVARGQLRQYAPAELIGFNEIESDLLFLRPVLEAIGVYVDENVLKAAYYAKVSKYMESQGITSIDTLTTLVAQGRSYYPALTEELALRLAPRVSEVAEQMVENWRANDVESFRIYEERRTLTLRKSESGE